MSDQTLFLIQLKVNGYIPTMAGRGHQITNGDGRLSITDVGISTIITAGSGYQVMNGVLHGFPGEVPMVIMDGNQWNPVLVSV